MQSSPRARTRPQRDAAMGVLATLVGLDAEAPPAPPVRRRASAPGPLQRYRRAADLRALQDRHGGLRRGAQTTAAKELSCARVAAYLVPDLGRPSTKPRRGAGHERAPAGACRAATSPIQRIGRALRNGSRSNRRWRPRVGVDAETVALCARRKPARVHPPPGGRGEPTVEAHDGDARFPPRPGRPRAPWPLPRWPSPSCTPRRRTSCFS